MYGRGPRTNWFRVLLIHYVDSVSAAIARGKRPVTFRTRKLRLSAPMVLQGGPCGRVGHRRTSFECGRSTQCWVGLSCFPGRFACVRVCGLCGRLFAGVLRYLGVGRAGRVLWCWGCPLGGPPFFVSCCVVGLFSDGPFVIALDGRRSQGSAGDGWILAAAPRESTLGVW